MRSYARFPFVIAVTLALFAPQAAVAQEEPVEAEVPQCMAVIDVEAIPAGEAAVAITFTLSEDVGAITGIESPESGLAIAAPEDLPRVDMANEDAPAPEPIQMSNDAENTFTVYLNSAQAQEGTHDLWLIGEQGRCASQVVVQPAA